MTAKLFIFEQMAHNNTCVLFEQTQTALQKLLTERQMKLFAVRLQLTYFDMVLLSGHTVHNYKCP